MLSNLNIREGQESLPALMFYRAARKRASAFSTLRTERGKKARISSSL